MQCAEIKKNTLTSFIGAFSQNSSSEYTWDILRRIITLKIGKEEIFMKISEIVEILNIPDIPFCPQMYGNPNKGLTIYASNQGVCYSEHASVWFLGEDEKCKDQVKQLKYELSNIFKGLEGNSRKLDRYVAVSELLLAIQQYSGVQSSLDSITEKIVEYAEKLNQAIIDSLDFSQIEDKKDLIDYITKDKLYHELLFNVDEEHGPKYTFGNMKYHEELDVVNITISGDSVSLHMAAEGAKTYSDTLRPNSTSEQKIFRALYTWRCAYLD